jgi:hypothetical protein
MDETKGFFASLFDFTFTDFVTTKIIRLLYILWIIASGIGALVAIVAAFAAHAALGLLTLIILAPLGFIISIIYGRVCLEIIIVIFRIAEHTGEIAKRGHPEP